MADYASAEPILPASLYQCIGLLGASAIESRFEAMRTAMTPLVGRDEEIDLLLRRWEQVMWTGVKYAITSEWDVIAAYYHYIQNSYFGTPTGGPAPCSGSEHPQCAGTFDAISAVIDWRFAEKWDVYVGAMFSQVNGGLSYGFLQRNNFDPTVGLRFRF